MHGCQADVPRANCARGSVLSRSELAIQLSWAFGASGISGHLGLTGRNPNSVQPLPKSKLSLARLRALALTPKGRFSHWPRRPSQSVPASIRHSCATLLHQCANVHPGTLAPSA